MNYINTTFKKKYYYYIPSMSSYCDVRTGYIYHEAFVIQKYHVTELPQWWIDKVVTCEYEDMLDLIKDSAFK